MQPKDQCSQNWRVEIDSNNKKFSLLQKGYVTDFDLFIGWALFTETSNHKILYYNLEYPKYVTLDGQQIAMTYIYVNHTVELLFISHHKWFAKSSMARPSIFGPQAL